MGNFFAYSFLILKSSFFFGAVKRWQSFSNRTGNFVFFVSFFLFVSFLLDFFLRKNILLDMSIFTLAEVEEQIALYKQAILNLATAQEYRNGDFFVRRADLPQLREQLVWLENERQKLLSQKVSPVFMPGMPRR